ncbi:MAG TPA: PspC domain-containing protein [Candidatus Merdenecus merdavium]|nr:PspC domain-containing protein [Candidatus Merdenecus merdavium]
MSEKKLYKSRDNRMICGVCGGIAEYVNMDPTIIRLIAVALILSQVGIIMYIAAAIIMPEKNSNTY